MGYEPIFGMADPCHVCGKVAINHFDQFAVALKASRSLADAMETIPLCSDCTETIKKSIIFIEVHESENPESTIPMRTGRQYIVDCSIAKQRMKGFDFDNNKVFFIKASVAKKIGFFGLRK